MNNKIILRTHYWDDSVADLAGKLSGIKDFDFAVVTDQTSKPFEIGHNYSRIPLTRDLLKEEGLPEAENFGWVCGDYCFYMADRYWDEYDFIWIVEPDVHFDFENLSGFFHYFLDFDDDLIAPYFGQYGEGWGWYKAARSLGVPVYGCIFPLVRLSRRAVKCLRDHRRTFDGPLEQGLFPNDESFTASILSNMKYKCRDLNKFGQEFINPQTFGFWLPFSPCQRILYECKNLVYHPVLTGARLRRKFENSIHEADQNRLVALSTRLADLESEFGIATLKNLKERIETKASQLQIPNISQLQIPNIPVRRDGTLMTLRQNPTAHIFVTDPRDYIQAVQLSGRFYESEDLNALETFVTEKVNALDIGAHTGNHTVFFGKVLQFERLFVIEPLAEAHTALTINLSINGLLEKSDLRHLNYGFGDSEYFGVLEFNPDNWGMTRVRRAVFGDNPGIAIPVVPGDKLYPDERFDLIKIDVPDHVFSILAGLTETIRRSDCILYLSLEKSELPLLEDFCSRTGFKVLYSASRYECQKNLILKKPSTK